MKKSVSRFVKNIVRELKKRSLRKERVLYRWIDLAPMADSEFKYRPKSVQRATVKTVNQRRRSILNAARDEGMFGCPVNDSAFHPEWGILRNEPESVDAAAKFVDRMVGEGHAGLYFNFAATQDGFPYLRWLDTNARNALGKGRQQVVRYHDASKANFFSPEALACIQFTAPRQFRLEAGQEE